jgi:flagella basal body P-ring formation protein FlgA
MPITAFSTVSPLPTKAVEIHLEPEISVGGEQVLLGDVATIYAKSMSDFRALSELPISRIPDDQKEVRLPATYLEARVRAALPPGVEFSLRAPKEITFRLERLGIGAKEIAAEISRLGRSAGKIPEGVEAEIQPLSGLDQLAAHKLADTKIEAVAELKHWKGDMSFRLSRKSGDPVWLKVKLRWFQNAWVAKRGILFTESPDPSMFEAGKVETTALREEPLGGSAEDLARFLRNARIKRQISANSPLLASMLDRKPDAAVGSALRVVFVSESGVRVTADGSLLSPGLIGADVKARLRSSKKVVTGKLVSQGLVEVSL